MSETETKSSCEALWDYTHKLEEIIQALRYGRDIPHQHLFHGRIANEVMDNLKARGRCITDATPQEKRTDQPATMRSAEGWQEEWINSRGYQQLDLIRAIQHDAMQSQSQAIRDKTLAEAAYLIDHGQAWSEDGLCGMVARNSMAAAIRSLYETPPAEDKARDLIMQLRDAIKETNDTICFTIGRLMGCDKGYEELTHIYKKNEDVFAAANAYLEGKV